MINKTIGVVIGFKLYIKQEILKDRYDVDVSVSELLHNPWSVEYDLNDTEIEEYLGETYGIRKKVQLYYIVIDESKFNYFMLKHPELIIKIY